VWQVTSNFIGMPVFSSYLLAKMESMKIAIREYKTMYHAIDFNETEFKETLYQVILIIFM
jgi:hypothetical protein